MENVVNTLSVFEGKRVLVTGHTGFKGSWLSLWLKQLGAEVVGFALAPSSRNDHFCLLKLKNEIHHHEGDIRNLSEIVKIFKIYQPECVFHLAAQPLVRESYRIPALTFGTNVCGSVNLLDAVRTAESVRTLIYVTSDKCYLNKGWVWGYRENDELGGRDPYSASKAAAELAFRAYWESFFFGIPELGAAAVRAGNVIGGGDRSLDRIVPDAISALEHQKPVVVRNPRATRPWQYVLDPIFGYLKLAAALFEKPKQFSGVWNFGPSEQDIKTVDDLVDTIVKSWGTGKIEYLGSENQLHEEEVLHLSSEKARRILAWDSRMDFYTAVKETVHWYKSVHDGVSPIKISNEKISDYMHRGA